MRSRRINVLGGGPAGLAVGYYAKRHDVPFTIYEASARVGGNATTFQRRVAGGEFRFDSGAHRFHDKDPEITREVTALLGADLRRIHAPSLIHDRGQFFDFPLSPLNLFRSLGAVDFLRASLEVAAGRLARNEAPTSFEDFALTTYGRTVASRFLLSYSEKLWGVPCNELSTTVGGNRLKGLDLRTLVVEAVFGSRAKTEHLDGVFYYPRGGYGTLTNRMADVCGAENIRLRAPVTAIGHDGKRIVGLTIGDGERVDADDVVSSLPLGLFLRIMDPPPPKPLLELCRRLTYRSVVLTVLFVDRASITDAATVYFPEPDIPFTRISEPRNRDEGMAPAGKTSLMVELPCQPGDDVWERDPDELADEVAAHLIRLGWLRRRELIGHSVVRLPNAYPVLRRGFEQLLEPVFEYLDSFDNLQLCGRSGRFAYTHVHDLLRSGLNMISAYGQAKAS